MTITDVKNLSKALQHKEDADDTLRQINRIFRNKSCRTIIKEVKLLMQQLSGNDGSKALFLVVLSLLYKNVDLIDQIQKALTDEHLISNLYGSLRIFFGGKSPSMCLKLQLTDYHFPNKYDYLTRFSDQFRYLEVREALYAAKILAISDRRKFEELAFQDSTRLILLNMTSFHLDETPSDQLITRLLEDGDELQANIGFYFAVWDITRDVQDYELLRRNSNLSGVRIPGMKNKHQIDKSITAHLETFHTFYNRCSDTRKASLLTNYILSENAYPLQFGHWLMEAELQEGLLYEITASGKVKTLDDLQRIAHLIHDFPCRDSNGVRQKKDRLYAAVVSVLKKFISERQGIYQWNEQKKALFHEICDVLPKRYRKMLYTYLEKAAADLMISKLDELARFSIYLNDKTQWDICRGMMEILNEAGNL